MLHTFTSFFHLSIQLYIFTLSQRKTLITTPASHFFQLYWKRKEDFNMQRLMLLWNLLSFSTYGNFCNYLSPSGFHPLSCIFIQSYSRKVWNLISTLENWNTIHHLYRTLSISWMFKKKIVLCKYEKQIWIL